MSPPAQPADGADPLLPLLEAAHRGDQAAFQQLFNASNRRLYGLAFTIVGNSADADDVVAEAYLQAWRNRLRLPWKKWATARPRPTSTSSERFWSTI